jgi:hypothetical protein
MIFYSILFSLGKPQENQYIYMLMLLYKSLVRTGSIGPQDKFFVVADEPTIEYARTFHSLASVLWVPAPAVKTLKDGMLYKYLFRPKVDEVVVYLDCDFLAKKKVSFDLKPDTLAVLPEGPSTDTNYCGDAPLASKAGVSAGFFVFRHGPRCKQILDDIAKAVAKCDKNFYTLDQPHFNHALQGKENVAVINPTAVSFNGHGNLGAATLINCAGIPGDGEFHFKKMMDFAMTL